MVTNRYLIKLFSTTDNNFVKDVTEQLFDELASVPDKPDVKLPKEKKMEKLGLDLIALNIQRARDHGIPGYTTIKHRCYPNDPEIKSFEDLVEDIPKTVSTSMPFIYI